MATLARVLRDLTQRDQPRPHIEELVKSSFLDLLREPDDELGPYVVRALRHFCDEEAARKKLVELASSTDPDLTISRLEASHILDTNQCESG